MRKIFAIFLTCLFLFISLGAVYPQKAYSFEVLGVSTQEPNVFPDSPFYFLKTFWERFQEFFARDPLKKAELHLKFANERLLEAQKLCERGKCGVARVWLERFQEQVEKATQSIEEVRQKGRDVVALLEELQENLEYQQKVLGEVLEKVAE